VGGPLRLSAAGPERPTFCAIALVCRCALTRARCRDPAFVNASTTDLWCLTASSRGIGRRWLLVGRDDAAASAVATAPLLVLHVSDDHGSRSRAAAVLSRPWVVPMSI